MTGEPFDFRRPPPGEIERQAAGWLTLACRRAAPVWSKLIPFPVELKPGPVEAVVAAAGLSRIPEDALAFPVRTEDPEDGVVLLAIRRPLLLALVAGLLGDVPEKAPDDREPTELEASLIAFLARELFLDVLERGWSAPNPPKLSTPGATTVRLGWKTPPENLSVTAEWKVTAPFGEYTVYLVFPRVGRWERLGRPDRRAEGEVAIPPKDQIEALVCEMAVDFSVVLGTADMTMHELAELKAGDMVVLRRKTSEPLDGLVAGARKFRVWPGIVGTRAAVAIDSPSED